MQAQNVPLSQIKQYDNEFRKCGENEIEREKLNLIFNRHPKEGMKVMKVLAGIISKRLVRTYYELLSARA